MENKELERFFEEVVNTGDMELITKVIGKLDYQSLGYLVTKYLNESGNINA